MESEENAQWQANPLDHRPRIKTIEAELQNDNKSLGIESLSTKSIYLNWAILDFLNFKGIDDPHSDIAN